MASVSEQATKLDRATSPTTKPLEKTPLPTDTGRPSRALGRHPAPSLFIGPPAKNASAPELTLSSSTEHSDMRANPSRFHAGRLEEAATFGRDTAEEKYGGIKHPSNPVFSDLRRGGAGGPGAGLGLRGEDRERARERERDRAETIWAEMQNTLEEVELNAAGGGNVFSREHARALEDLRRAQIALAQAWTRSEADDGASGETDEGLHSGKPREDALGSSNLLGERQTDGHDGNKIGRENISSGRKGFVDGGGDKTQLEVETENDIMLARKRRQANDRYFEKVNKGVVDVVAKLQDVAQRMKAVEMESKEVWGDNDSIETGTEV